MWGEQWGTMLWGQEIIDALPMMDATGLTILITTLILGGIFFVKRTRRPQSTS